LAAREGGGGKFVRRVAEARIASAHARARAPTCVDAQHAGVVDLDAHVAGSEAGKVGEDL
jgi:hypothetical protein